VAPAGRKPIGVRFPRIRPDQVTIDPDGPRLALCGDRSTSLLSTYKLDSDSRGVPQGTSGRKMTGTNRRFIIFQWKVWLKDQNRNGRENEHTAENGCHAQADDTLFPIDLFFRPLSAANIC
jgi:hypothetical protein